MATSKTDKKVVKAPAKKVTAKKRSVKADELMLDVPLGGQVIGEYTLIPKVPKNGKHGDWKLIDSTTHKEVSALMSVGFSEKTSGVQFELERAVLVINMTEKDKKGYWRFALDGISICSTEGDQVHDIYTEIYNNGRTLVIYAHSLDLGKEVINYSFVAAYTDAASGQTNIYESADPTIIVIRPRGG